MHIPGYLDGFRPPLAASPLVDATRWVDDELFWPAFLCCLGLASSAPDAFDVDRADLDVYLDEFDQPDAWPVFAIPIGGGTMHLIARNFPDDAGIDWVIDADVHAALEQLTNESGRSSENPWLPWSLLPEEPPYLLMALPAIGDDEVPDGIPGVVAQAVRTVGATARIEELAEDLLQHRPCVFL